MALTEKINEDMKAAMRAKDKERLEALRSVKSALLLLQTEKGGNKEISEDAEVGLIQKLVKQRKESAEIYQKQNREDLYEKEIKEANILAEYLPKQLSEQELEESVKSIIDKSGASGPSDMGKVMGVASQELKGKAEGKAIAQKVKELLAKLQ
jgi:hypothetical protein